MVYSKEEIENRIRALLTADSEMVEREIFIALAASGTGHEGAVSVASHVRKQAAANPGTVFFLRFYGIDQSEPQVDVIIHVPPMASGLAFLCGIDEAGAAYLSADRVRHEARSKLGRQYAQLRSRPMQAA